MASQQNQILIATYTRSDSTAQDDPKQFSHDLPAIKGTHTTEERTAYLSALHDSISKLQSEVNTFLTDEMAKDAASSGSATSKASAEAKEEANYGEEVVE